MRLRTIAGGATVTVGLLAGSVLPAHAGTNGGVEDLHAEPVALTCQPGQALPCEPGSGTGDSGVLQVSQSDDSGEMRFDRLEGTSALGTDHVWFGLEVGATCKGLYDIDYYELSPERGDDDWKVSAWTTPPEVAPEHPEGFWNAIVPAPDAAHMPDKVVVLDLAVDDLLGFYGGAHTSAYWFGEDSVLDQGEGVVAQRVADGMSEAQARATGFHVDSTVLLSATVGCEKANGAMWFKRVERELPLRVEFLAAPHQGVKEQTPTLDVSAPVQVTDVDLDVAVDRQDPCRLDLTGTVETTGATEVEYRFLNPYGQPSNTFQLQVDDSRTGTVTSHVDVPGHDTTDPSGDLVADPSVADPGQEWAAPGTDDDVWSGTFTLQVLSPNGMTDVAGFQVERCTAVRVLGDGAPGDVVDAPVPGSSRTTSDGVVATPAPTTEAVHLGLLLNG